jgi:DNA-binding response OmpR family regulator
MHKQSDGFGNGARILVVDDDPDLCDMLMICLIAEGYTVECAGDGQEALEKVALFSPNLILLDLWLPVLDGRGVATCLRASGKSIPVVVISAADNGRNVVQEIGAAAFLEKPFALRDLVEMVEVFLRVPDDHRYVAVSE